jgi:hypothetical protein
VKMPPRPFLAYPVLQYRVVTDGGIRQRRESHPRAMYWITRMLLHSITRMLDFNRSNRGREGPPPPRVQHAGESRRAYMSRLHIATTFRPVRTCILRCQSSGLRGRVQGGRSAGWQSLGPAPSEKEHLVGVARPALLGGGLVAKGRGRQHRT